MFKDTRPLLTLALWYQKRLIQALWYQKSASATLFCSRLKPLLQQIHYRG